MSRVISFRLDDSDPESDETRALEVLRNAEAKGFTTRQTIVAALLMADQQQLTRQLDQHADLIAVIRETVENSNGAGAIIAELRGVLSQAKELTELLRSAPKAPVQDDSKSALKPELKAAMKRAMKPGLKLE